MQAGELIVEDRAQDSRHTLVLAGELDLATASDLDASILRACGDGAKEVVLDLSDLVFVDSTGLRAVIGARSTCEHHGCSFVLMHAQEPVERLFELTGLAQKLPFRSRAPAAPSDSVG